MSAVFLTKDEVAFLELEPSSPTLTPSLAALGCTKGQADRSGSGMRQTGFAYLFNKRLLNVSQVLCVF